MTEHGTTTPFDSTLEDWTTYVEHLQMYFIANDIANDSKMQAILLSVCGRTTYQLVHNLAQPKKPPDLSYVELVQLLSNHYFPSHSLLVHHFRFNSRCHHLGETVASYTTELHRLSEHCQLGESLVTMLHNHLVSGINDECMQCCCLAESAEHNVHYLHKSSLQVLHAVLPVKRLQAPRRTARPCPPHSQMSPPQSSASVCRAKPPIPCPHCARSHLARDCQFRTSVCHKCGKTGHIRCFCHSRGNNQQHPRKPHKLSRDTHCSFMLESDNHDNHAYNVF